MADQDGAQPGKGRTADDEQVSAGMEAINRFNRFYADLIDSSARDIEGKLEGINAVDLQRLMTSMRTIEEILSGRPRKEAEVKIRPHRPGDMGFVAYRHGVLYELEDGFDTSFDGYVIGGLHQFAQQYDPEEDELWVALRGDELVGTIAIVNAGEGEAQLRWFLVEPEVRGLGVGRRLLETALDFCAQKGYQRVYLWTLSHLAAARSLYERYGFKLTETKTHAIWGRTLTEERWDLIP